jgi:hypothetical protein
VSSDFPALQQVLARSYAARAIRFGIDAVRTAWAHSMTLRQVERGHAALGSLPADARLRFWSITIIWMGIGMMLTGVLVPRYSAPVWPVGQGLALSLLGAVLAAASTPLAAAWPKSGLRRWLRAESSN